ncbi:MAG: Asp-tRNA(Asn)/Glu-tRNA(Gln) amidotransferase subunit GatA [Chlamydiota bacterium]|nr:Asp-tRNA(Asn)/Glu-tRNA(Gln) amidotransferase subunit GatA [Chlamydiota bacterium]
MHNLTAIEIRDKFLSGEFSAEEIVTHFLNRIEKYDNKIKAFITVYKERAIEHAKALDEKKAKGEKLGKLAGIPVALKDNIHVKGETTTCASKFLSNYTAPFDATVTRLLESEDAIIIGKTNLDEFAMGSSTENSAMQSTGNPWDLDRVPGGSSGGSAAAVAGRLCPLSLGSDTGGSIRQPASLCGIYGYKPTYGRISRFGLVAFGSSLDQIGPFATSIEDIALIMEVLGKHCERDSTSIPKPNENYLENFDVDVSKLKIGVPWAFLKDLAPEAKKTFEEALNVYEKMGAEVVEVNLDILKHSIAVYYILATAEASTNLARFDGVRYGHRSPRAQTLREVYDYSKEDGFGPEVKRRILLGTYVLSSGYQDAYYKKAQKVRTLMIEQYKKAFETCDVIAMPVTPFTAFKKGEIKDPVQMYLEDIYTISCNLAGIPGISIPDGFSSEGLPLGLQLFAPQKEDVRLISIANEYQKATDHYKKIPEFVK